MVSINLLKERFERRTRRRPVAELCIGTFVLAAVVAGWGWMVVDGNRVIHHLERDIRQKQDRLALMTQQRDRMLTLRKQRDAVVAERETLAALTRDRDRPVRLLSVIGRVIDPLDVWLRRLQTTDEKVTLSGVARSREAVLELAKHLERTDMLGSVDVFAMSPQAASPEQFQFSMNVFLDVADHG